MKNFTALWIIVFIGSGLFAQETTDSLSTKKTNTKITVLDQSQAEQLPSTSNSNPPLYIIFFKDKKYKMSGDTFREIKPEWIDSVNVSKNEQSTNRYGESGKYGTVEIFLKNDDSIKLSREFLEELD